MVFSSTLFLFLFLPIVLLLHAVFPKQLRNGLILLVSLFFYAWGEQELVLLMCGSIAFNYFIGRVIGNGQPNRAKLVLTLGIFINILTLVYYKYIGFIFENITSTFGVTKPFDTSGITLPIGISFFTFQSISYLIDVYRGVVKSQKNIISLGMYIALFPQLIAGPIVRYIDIAKEIKERTITLEGFQEGVSRFIIGLAKKVIIANNMAIFADHIFSLPTNQLSVVSAWIGILCYALQIYFDFSGYSDMAIGLGKLFGFNFKENFNHPYISQSITEFWRRWHISLSSWFKDYLYIPLGGNRKGQSRTYINLSIVFFITGLWHGASWNFIVWGLFHGLFIVLEKMNPYTLPNTFKGLKIGYTLLIVLIGWVFFRTEDLSTALEYIQALFNANSGTINHSYLVYITPYSILIFCLGILFSTPLKTRIHQWFQPVLKPHTNAFLRYSFNIGLFLLSVMELAQTTHNPFIYFRF